MERIKKVLFCRVLNKEIVTTYFFVNNNGRNTASAKSIQFYNCSAKKECEDNYNIMDCPSFKETGKVEMEINKILR
jgi:hypothetical protein